MSYYKRRIEYCFLTILTYNPTLFPNICCMNFKKLLTQSIVWRGLYFAALFMVNVVLSRYLHADGTGKIFFISNTFALIQLFAGFCLEGAITYLGHQKLSVLIKYCGFVYCGRCLLSFFSCLSLLYGAIPTIICLKD